MDVNLAVIEIQQSDYSTTGRDGAEQSEPHHRDKRQIHLRDSGSRNLIRKR